LTLLKNCTLMGQLSICYILFYFPMNCGFCRLFIMDIVSDLVLLGDCNTDER
jgi:hypothetical protein